MHEFFSIQSSIENTKRIPTRKNFWICYVCFVLTADIASGAINLKTYFDFQQRQSGLVYGKINDDKLMALYSFFWIQSILILAEIFVAIYCLRRFSYGLFFFDCASLSIIFLTTIPILSIQLFVHACEDFPISTGLSFGSYLNSILFFCRLAFLLILFRIVLRRCYELNKRACGEKKSLLDKDKSISAISTSEDMCYRSLDEFESKRDLFIWTTIRGLLVCGLCLLFIINIFILTGTIYQNDVVKNEQRTGHFNLHTQLRTELRRRYLENIAIFAPLQMLDGNASISDEWIRLAEVKSVISWKQTGANLLIEMTAMGDQADPTFIICTMIKFKYGAQYIRTSCWRRSSKNYIDQACPSEYQPPDGTKINLYVSNRTSSIFLRLFYVDPDSARPLGKMMYTAVKVDHIAHRKEKLLLNLRYGRKVLNTTENSLLEEESVPFIVKEIAGDVKLFEAYSFSKTVQDMQGIWTTGLLSCSPKTPLRLDRKD